MGDKIIPLYDAASMQAQKMTAALHEESQKKKSALIKRKSKVKPVEALCEVKVSCTPKAEMADGSLEVCFEYTGDPKVVSFLLDQAQMALEASDMDS